MAISTAELFAQENKPIKTADLINKQTMKDPSKPEPPPFDFDKAISVLDIPLDAVDSVKRGFVSAMQPFTQPWENVGYSTASSLNRGTAVFATHLDHIADYVEKKTGMKKGGAFGEWAKKYNENADYWQKQAQENGATFLQEFFGEVAGGAVPGIAEFMLNVPYAVALGAAESDKKGRGEVAGAIIEGAKRGTLGAVFHTMAPFQQYLRAPMMGGVFALQTATEGGDLKEVAKAGATGAIYSWTSPGGRIGLNDIKRNIDMQIVKDRAAEPVEVVERKTPAEQTLPEEGLTERVKPEVAELQPEITKKKSFYDALSITSDKDTIDFVLMEMKADLQRGEAGGLKGTDNATGKNIYLGSGHVQWFRDLTKEYGKENKSNTGKKESISASQLITVIDKGMKGGKLTERQTALWERLNRVADYEAYKTYSPIVEQYQKAKGAEHDRINEEIDKYESGGIDYGRTENSSEQLKADLVREIEAEGIDSEAAFAEVNDFFKSIAEARQLETNRRVNYTHRKKVSEMTPDERATALLTDPLTLQKNKRAYEESERQPYQASIDVDGLKYVNDTYGHDAGNALLQKVGDALNRASDGKNNYHFHGDEFALEGKTPAEIEAIIAKAKQILKDEPLEFNGEKITPDFSHGIAKDLKEADRVMLENKTARKVERGKKPKGNFETANIPGTDSFNLINPEMPDGGKLLEQVSQKNGDLFFAPEANFRRQPEQAEKTDDITRRSDLVRFLNEKLDIPIRTGRFRDQALGIFKLRPEVIRTEKANDIEVIAHEIGHAIQKFLYPEAVTQAGLASRPFSAFKNELDPMASKPKAGQDVTPEGFAEFIRLYVTNEPMAREKAPQFYEHFEKELQNKSPETREILLEARRQYDRWLKQPELQRVLSQVSVGAKEQREFSFDKLYTATVDDLFPLKKVVDEMAKGRDLKPGDDPYILARLLRGYTGKADAFIDHSPFKFKTYGDVGKSLKDILAPVRSDLDAFRGYIVSRRTIDLERRKIETGVLPADARKVINDYDAKFRKAFDELKEYQDHTLQYLKDSGVMDQKTFDQIKQMNEDYVPLYRIMDDKPGKAGVGVGMIARNPVKKITGSWRDIQDPLESIIKNTYLYINAAEKNAVGRALVKLAENTEGMGKYIEKIPTPMQEIKIKPDELKKLGIDEVPENVVSIFRPQSFMPKDNVISVWDEGKRTLYEVHPDVAKTFMALDKENLNLLMKVLSKPASWLRAGATLTPEFIARNPFRDQFSAFVYSKYGFIPGYDLAQGIFSIAKKDQMYWDWKKGGGDHSMLVSMDRDYLQDKLGETLTKYPVLNRIKNPIELLRIASELGEEGTRIGEFKKGIKAEGQTKEGIQAAAFAARDITLDFSKVGTIGKSVNIITAFWNAQVQGMDKMVREFKDNPDRTTAKVAAAITLPSVLLAIATHDDPRIKEVPAWERDLFWIIPTENHLFRIPKPFELGVLFGSVPERITHFILDKDPHAFDELLTTVVNGATPGFVPTAAIPIMENWANKSVFFNRSIVPTGRTELLPEYQYSQYTTETAKQIGKIIGKLPWEIEQASPARVENLVRGWTGGLGMYALNIADQGLLKAGIVERDFETPSKTLSEIPFVRAFHVRYPSSNAESIQRFYDNYEKSNQIIKTAKVLMEKEYKPDDAIRLLETNAVNLQGTFEAVNNIRQMISMIYINPEMTGDEKREMIDILYMQMIDVAKAGNDVFDSMKKIND